MTEYIDRLVDSQLAQILQAQSAVMVTGVRACGKSTTASRYASSVASLDQPRVAQAFEADPDVALGSMQEPALVDEWQLVPAILGAVKRAVDSDSGRGRFIVTGSTAGSARGPQWPATGRLVDVTMYPLTVRELKGRLLAPSLAERLLSQVELQPSGEGEDLGDYIDWALQGGFPEAALRLEGQDRVDWLQAYVRRLITRDIPEGAGGRDPEALSRFFQGLCLNSAGVVQDTTLSSVSGVSLMTARAYDAILRNVLVESHIPAWFTNRLSRLTKSPKRYLCDTSLMCASIGATRSTILQDGDLLGRVIETFVVAQLRAELSASMPGARMYHLRTQEGRQEIDVVIEYDAFRVAAIEIKASATPTVRDARHLIWLREQLGDRFVGGVVLHTGPQTINLAENIVAAPISTLWQ